MWVFDGETWMREGQTPEELSHSDSEQREDLKEIEQTDLRVVEIPMTRPEAPPIPWLPSN